MQPARTHFSPQEGFQEFFQLIGKSESIHCASKLLLAGIAGASERCTSVNSIWQDGEHHEQSGIFKCIAYCSSSYVSSNSSETLRVSVMRETSLT